MNANWTEPAAEGRCRRLPILIGKGPENPFGDGFREIFHSSTRAEFFSGPLMPIITCLLNVSAEFRFKRTAWYLLLIINNLVIYERYFHDCKNHYNLIQQNF
jgi:hypothetical protein